MAKVTIRLGLMATNGRTHNLKSRIEENENRVFMVCPRCKASRISSAAICAENCCDQVFDRSELNLRGRMEGEKMVVIPADAIREAKTEVSTPLGDLTLAIHPSEGFEGECVENGSSYVFVPDKADPFYSLLLDLAMDAGYAIVGMLTMSQNGLAKLYRLHNIGGRLMMRETLLPSQTAMIAPIPGQAPKPKEAAMFSQLVSIMVEDFDPALYTNERQAAIRKLIEKAAGTKPPAKRPVKKGVKVADTSDLEDQLEAALAAQKARKAS